MAVVTPLNNFLGPEGDTVTMDEQLLNTEYWVQRALYLLVHGQVTQFSPNLPLACGSQGAEGPVSTCPKTNDAVLPQPPTHQ